MAATVMTTGRGGRYRWAAIRFIVVGIVALVLVVSGIATESAMAGMSQHEYVQECKAGGGTSKRLGTHKVQCTIGSWSQVCDFNFDPPSCYTPFEVPAPTTTNGPRGPLAGGTYNAGQTGSSGPWGQGGGTWTVTESVYAAEVAPSNDPTGQTGADGEPDVVVPAGGAWIERIDDEEP